MASSLDVDQETKGLFALFKGPSGAGKSVGALSYPSPYVLDFDAKQPGIARKHFPGKDVQYDQFEDIFGACAVLDNLQDNCPYETLILDSITSLTYNIIKSVAALKGEETPKMLKRLKGIKNSSLEMLGYDYYNGETRFIKYILDVLKALWKQPGNPRNVIVIAHVLETEREDIKTKIVTKTRTIVTAGKAVAAYIPAQFDDEWHFALERPDLGSDSGSIGHVVCTESFGDESAKCSIRLPRYIDFTETGKNGGNLYETIQKLTKPVIKGVI